MAVKLNLLSQGKEVSGVWKNFKIYKIFWNYCFGNIPVFYSWRIRFLVYSSIKLTGLSTQEESLKARIKSQESKAKIVLIKTVWPES